MRRSLSLILLALVVSGARLQSQEQPAAALAALHAGATIRIWSDTPPMTQQTAFFVVAERDSLRVALEYGASTSHAAIRYDALRRVDVQLPRSRARGALRGLGFGVLTALAVDVALVAYAGTQNKGDTDLMTALIGVVSTPIIVAGGTIIGAASPGERWSVVYRRQAL